MLELSERIKRAFKHDGFRLAYQPIIEAASGMPVCYEALVRMFGDDGKPISAALFVPAIEQMGLAFELDKLVLDIAVRTMEEMPSLSLAINVSGLTASQADWPEHLNKVLESRPEVARRLIVEITETAALVNIAETQRFSEVLRSLGGQVSLDDFGAGATSIRYLRELGLSIMKIDKDLLNRYSNQQGTAASGNGADRTGARPRHPNRRRGRRNRRCRHMAARRARRLHAGLLFRQTLPGTPRRRSRRSLVVPA